MAHKKIMAEMADELAMLRSMFPSWDVEVLEELLIAHQGSVERAVDSVLTMEMMPNTGKAQASQSPPALAQTPVSPTRQQRNFLALPPSFSPRGQPHGRVKLPDDFLRLPVEEFCGLSEQEERDAILAHMLQDQFFRDEILSSEEFSSHFHEDRSMRQSQRYAPEKTAAEIASEAYEVMSQKFTSMSEVMKSKMHDMYMRFQVRDDASVSKDPKSTRPLMESDSDSNDDEDLNDNFGIQHRNMDHRRTQGCARRWSSSNTTEKPNTGTVAFSKKDD